jgi:hypothetical protein
VQAQTKYNSKFNINEAFNNFKHKQHAKQENPLTKSDNQKYRKQTFQDNMFLSNDKNALSGAATMRTRIKENGTTPAINIFQTYLKQSTLASPIMMDKMIGGDNFCDIDTVDDFFDFQRKQQEDPKESFKEKLLSFKSDFNMLIKN